LRRSTQARADFRLLDRVADPILIFDRSTHRILDCNAATLRVYGYTRAELRRMTPFDLHPHEEIDKVRSTIDVHNFDNAFTYTHVTKDGRRLAVETLSETAMYRGRRAWITVVRDISARKRAEDALRESEARFRILADSTPVLIWMTGTDSGCTYCNRSLLEFTGWAPEQALGEGWAASVHPEDLTRVMTIYREAFEARREFRTEYRLRRADGVFRWVLVLGVPRRTAEGAFDGYIGSCMDITERRDLEETMARARDHAEAAARAKGEFLATMSHELRTPMNAVLGMTSVLLDSALDVEQRDCVETIRTSGTALLELIQDVLEYSQLDAGSARRETQAFDLRECIAACVDLMSERAAAQGLRIDYELAPDVPERVVTDVTRLRQVLVHLLDNAIKFSHVGSVSVRVTMGSYTQGDPSLCIAVADTGIGIAADRMLHLFEPFTPGDPSLSRAYDGAGLGLALCRKLCALLGGTLTVESRLGLGSTFTVRVPVRASGERTPRGEGATLLGDSRPTCEPANAVRVLLVEDNPVNQRFVLRLLDRLGHRSDAVASSSEALTALARQPYDLVLMDVSLPEMDGFEATRALRVLPGLRQPRVIGMSNGGRGERGRCLAAGMDDCIRKPIRLSVLRAALERRAAAATKFFP